MWLLFSADPRYDLHGVAEEPLAEEHVVVKPGTQRTRWMSSGCYTLLVDCQYVFFLIQYTYTQYTQYIGDYHNPWILNDGWFSDASSRGLAMIRGYSRVIVSGDTVETFAPAEPWRSELNIFLERPWKGISNDTREHVNVRSSCFSFY